MMIGVYSAILSTIPCNPSKNELYALGKPFIKPFDRLTAQSSPLSINSLSNLTLPSNNLFNVGIMLSFSKSLSHYLRYRSMLIIAHLVFDFVFPLIQSIDRPR